MISPGRSPAMLEKVLSPTTPSQPLAVLGSSKSRRCRSCYATSARTASSTTSRRTSRPPPHRFTRRRLSIWAGRCIGTDKTLAKFDLSDERSSHGKAASTFGVYIELVSFSDYDDQKDSRHETRQHQKRRCEAASGQAG